MSKIKVLVNKVEQANELIDHWKDKDVDLEISVKENTTAANSDVILKKLISNQKNTDNVLLKLIRYNILVENRRNQTKK